jgi:hypothetical protein
LRPAKIPVVELVGVLRRAPVTSIPEERRYERISIRCPERVRPPYIWQFYLPRLPTMANYFPGLLTVCDLWFDRIVGLYGWLDTSFPVWVENLALIPATLLAILALHTLYERRSALARRAPELCTYGLMAAGLLVLTGGGAYLSKSTNGVSFAQPRYLLPLLPLGAAGLALAVQGAGKRSAGAIGALIVTLFFAHEVFSQLLVVARYYG